MKVIVTSYKPSGKWYTEEIIDVPDTAFYATDFKDSIVGKVPILEDGYVLVKSLDGERFINHLFKSSDFNEVNT